MNLQGMHDPQLTHHIQVDILLLMLKSSESRYSDIKPSGVEPNLFVYHLRQLMKLGFIEKHDKMYVLTRAGKRFIDRATLTTMKVRIQPKVITVLAIKRDDGTWLVLERRHQPFLGYKGFPSGKMHYGETLQEAAQRELEGKSGLAGVDLRLRGTFIMRFLDGEETVNYIIGYVFYGEVPVGTEVGYSRENYNCYFAPKAEFFAEPSFKGHHQIHELLETRSDLFIEQYDFQSDY